ncbi:MAG: DUF4136 domain-containing protein [Calditrichia bacterium]
MKIVYIYLIAAMVLIAIGCSSVSVNYDYDPATDFSKFKTYSIYNGQIEGDALSANPLIRKRFISSLENVLGEKGFKRVESEDEADFLVVIHAGVKERMQITNWGGYGWYGPGWGGYGGHTDVNYYDEANLVVDIVDLSRKELAWRGVATGVVEGPSNAERMQKRADDVIARVLRNFPPTKK